MKGKYVSKISSHSEKRKFEPHLAFNRSNKLICVYISCFTKSLIYIWSQRTNTIKNNNNKASLLQEREKSKVLFFLTDITVNRRILKFCLNYLLLTFCSKIYLWAISSLFFCVSWKWSIMITTMAKFRFPSPLLF